MATHSGGIKYRVVFLTANPSKHRTFLNCLSNILSIFHRKLLFPGAVSLFERYWKDSIYLSPDGPKCCSSKAVTFQGILSTSKMYQLEYLFHHLRPFAHGGVHGNVPPPPQKEDPFLTEEERLKAAMMQKWFDAQLMTTPSDMHLHHMPTVDY